MKFPFQSTCCGRPYTAFSLIELLVVMSVIVVLLAMLMPVLRDVRLNAATQKTVSNLKQLQAANTMYASANDGRYVPAQINGDWAGGMWFQNDGFLKYLGLRNTGRMWDEDWPEVAKSGHKTASPNIPPGKMDRQASIGINLGLRQHWAFPDGSFGDLSFRQQHIRRPAKAMAFADATDMWMRMDREDNWRSDQGGWYNMSIAYRNKGKAAIVFFDGHVELLTRQQVVNNWDLWIPDKAD
jgi:prepilin-type processing-associated H-X9-DG protein